MVTSRCEHEENERDACMFGGTVLYIHEQGDQVWEKESEFHFRHVEGLGNI